LERILIVANDSPFPLNHATALDTWGHIRSLKNLGFEVDMIVTIKNRPHEDDIRVMTGEVGHLALVERQRGWRTAASALPFQVQSRAALQTIPLEKKYAAVLLESEHVASILKNPSLNATKTILRLNNNEARFFRELSKSTQNLLIKAFHRVEAARFSRLSPRVVAKCDSLWFVSDYEMNEHLKACPADAAKSFFVPPRVEVSAMSRQSLEGQNVLFIGTLAFANNIRGVEWYISHLHRSLCNIPGYSFIVAGNTRGASNGSLTKLTTSQEKIFLHENPRELQSLYGAAAVFVNPVFHGAGLKVKNIDAIRAGMPVVTTSNGVEGSRLVHGKHLLVADSAASFETSIRTLLSNRKMAREMVASAQDFVVKEYDQEQIIKKSLSRV
jgi:glycosyltransferase involved in cell wall biosynthesis